MDRKLNDVFVHIIFISKSSMYQFIIHECLIETSCSVMPGRDDGISYKSCLITLKHNAKVVQNQAYVERTFIFLYMVYEYIQESK